MTHPAVDRIGRISASQPQLSVIEFLANTASHIVYSRAARADDPSLARGDTLAALRSWKNGFR